MAAKIGVLALQGGFELHSKRIAELGALPILIRKPEELDAIDGLIIPGGESSALLKLCPLPFREKISSFLTKGMPALVTCAGTILLAKKVSNPEQESLQIIDVEVERNAYGRQVDSFIAQDLKWSKEAGASLNLEEKETIEAVFIRAPKIKQVGKGVTVLLRFEAEPILVRQGSILAATFHPELSEGAVVHKLFLSLIPD